MSAKKTLIAAAACGLMTLTSVSAHAGQEDMASQMESIGPGTSEAELMEVMGTPDTSVIKGDRVVWEYSYEEVRRFQPDVEGTYQVVLEDGQVQKVFQKEGGLGVWAMASLVFLAVIFI